MYEVELEERVCPVCGLNGKLFTTERNNPGTKIAGYWICGEQHQWITLDIWDHGIQNYVWTKEKEIWHGQTPKHIRDGWHK